MVKKVQKVMQDNAWRNQFKNAKSGLSSFKGLEHKDGTPLKDIEYFELLGRKAIEMDKANKTRLPTNYGNYDPDTVKVAKEVVKAIDSGELTEDEINAYIQLCIDVEK